MSPFSRVIFILLMFIGSAFAAVKPLSSQVEFPPLPAEGHFVVDEAKILSSTDVEKINKIAGALFKEERIPLVVVTIKNLQSLNAAAMGIERFSLALLNHWQLGQKDENYSMLLVISKGDRKARIEFGLGFDHRYDREARNIMDNYMVFRFKDGHYSEGTLAGVEALDKLARGLDLPPVKTVWWHTPATILSSLLLLGVVISLFKSGRSGWGWALLAFIGVILWFILRNANSYGSGGISGGGVGGGGGATGSW